VACIILFWQFVIPQFKILSTAQEEVRQAELRLQTLKENLNVLRNTDEKSLDAQLKVLNLALPLNKDFSGILNSIYYASDKTGVNLGNFSLQIGDLLDSKKKDDFPTISLAIPVNANVVAVNSFVEAISKTVPLSEVTLIKISNMASTVRLSFYYKPLGLSSYKEDARIIPLTQKGLTIIHKLSSFENASSFQKIPVATSSGF
jgi:Tfp pilus assembly protein PilO